MELHCWIIGDFTIIAIHQIDAEFLIWAKKDVFPRTIFEF